MNQTTEDVFYKHHLADNQTQEARARLEQVKLLLHHSLVSYHILDWNALKSTAKFPEPHPQEKYSIEISKVQKPCEPVYLETPQSPQEADFQPQLGFLDRLFKFLRNKKRSAAMAQYVRASHHYFEKQQNVVAQNKVLLHNYEEAIAQAEQQINLLKQQCEEDTRSWNKASTAFYAEQKAQNERINELKNNYLSGEVNAVVAYCELVLNHSHYPVTFSKDFDLNYNHVAKLLVVDYVLPTPAQLPKLAEVRYSPVRGALEEIYLSDEQQASLYEDTIYQVTLRTLHELYKADQIDAIQCITFNGWINNTDNIHRKPTKVCVISIHVNKTQFEDLNLAEIDPKICFKSLRGVGSPNLVTVIPVQPLIQRDENDKRFVSTHEVANKLGEDKVSWTEPVESVRKE